MSIYNWLCLFGIPGMLTGLFTFIGVQIKQNKAMKLGLQAILRDRLLQAYHFYKHQGWASYDDSFCIFRNIFPAIHCKFNIFF